MSPALTYLLPRVTAAEIDFEKGGNLEGQCIELANLAARGSERLADDFGSISGVAARLVEEYQRRFSDPAHSHWTPQWPEFNAAVAAGLAGNVEFARNMFFDLSVSLGQRFPDVVGWLTSAAAALNSGNFRSFVHSEIDKNRARLEMTPWAGDF